MIVRVEFLKDYNQPLIKEFYKDPKGTCLTSITAVNITPQKIMDQTKSHISFWFLDDECMKHHYGADVCINALTTRPGIIRSSIVLQSKKITYKMIEDDLSEEELYNMLLPLL
jgi:hypothetical protein